MFYYCFCQGGQVLSLPIPLSSSHHRITELFLSSYFFWWNYLFPLSNYFMSKRNKIVLLLCAVKYKKNKHVSKASKTKFSV